MHVHLDIAAVHEIYLFTVLHFTIYTLLLCVIDSQVGKLADLVLWNPALFGAKPEIVVKGGQIAWSQMGKNNFF